VNISDNQFIFVGLMLKCINLKMPATHYKASAHCREEYFIFNIPSVLAGTTYIFFIILCELADG